MESMTKPRKKEFIPKGLIFLVDSGLLDIKIMDSYNKKDDIIFDLPDENEPIIEELDGDDIEPDIEPDIEVSDIIYPHNHWVHRLYPGMYKIGPIEVIFVCEKCHFFGKILSTRGTCPGCARKILFDGEMMRSENA